MKPKKRRNVLRTVRLLEKARKFSSLRSESKTNAHNPIRSVHLYDYAFFFFFCYLISQM